MALDGEFVVVVDGEEVCGCRFGDIGTLVNLLHGHAEGARVRVSVEGAAGVQELGQKTEDGA